MSEKEKVKEKMNEKEEAKAKTMKSKIKLCKGCLYQSSTRKSNSKDPFCFGFTTTVNDGLEDKSETISQTYKRKYNISYFKYGCIGTSAHLDEDHPWMKSHTEPAYCFGFELIIRNWSKHAPAHSNQDVVVQSSQSQSEPSSSVEPATSSSYDFQKRLARNLVVVASGVGKNAVNVGNRIKDRFNAIYPFGKRDD